MEDTVTRRLVTLLCSGLAMGWRLDASHHLSEMPGILVRTQPPPTIASDDAARIGDAPLVLDALSTMFLSFLGFGFRGMMDGWFE